MSEIINELTIRLITIASTNPSKFVYRLIIKYEDII